MLNLRLSSATVTVSDQRFASGELKKESVRASDSISVDIAVGLCSERRFTFILGYNQEPGSRAGGGLSH